MNKTKSLITRKRNSSDYQMPKYFAEVIGIGDFSIGGTIDGSIRMIQAPQSHSLAFCPLPKNSHPTFTKALFHGNCISYLLDSPVVVLPQKKEFYKNNFDFLPVTRPLSSLKPAFNYVYDSFSRDLCVALEAIWSLRNGPFVSIYQTYNFNDTSYFDYEIFWNPNQTATNIQYRVVAIYNHLIDISNYREISTGNWFIMKKSINKLNENFILGYNFPNPFNSSTTISYQLPEDGYFSLIVYDALGREVSKLVDDFVEAREYKINYNAKDLNSGIYFYTLRFNSYTETKHMLLLK